MIECQRCGLKEAHFLGDHLIEAHGLTPEEYLIKYPGAKVMSAELDQAVRDRAAPERAHPEIPENLRVDIAGITFPVHAHVPEEACLPMPERYHLPTSGKNKNAARHVLVALRARRSIYLWGITGSGKDAIVHAWSNWTRTPGAIYSIKPGMDIQPWLFSRKIDKDGSGWEEGPLLRQLRDGYEVKNSEGEVVLRIPYIIDVSDWDRADRSQAEVLRLILDSIRKRVEGPGGLSFRVLPGTIIMATGNTAGAGDERGRALSANPIDSTLMGRWNRVFQMPWMRWVDEETVLRRKFPYLSVKMPASIKALGGASDKIRKQIEEEELYGELSHRDLCNILEHVQDIIDATGKISPRVTSQGLSVWINRLPDRDNRLRARRLADAFIMGGTLDSEDLDDQFFDLEDESP